ncbi:DNA alkylation response protein [Modestobacter sp. I12A-02628]|uniref:DNA alkylation response protein n=1 Tax=Goekera deserti TaxID=2497753 RepID=A0A7K3WFW9_9ACTN|nr:acyl-CoA dehydrogenase family protein [Goekera deserti]MPQ96486.1 DNA alkylation response protein [Goekera deserti]NDI47199.1 DNA alkylation response protein [Goekera deserti]NEL55401.1 DNA alkylation response protein [Goekera deserti]
MTTTHEVFNQAEALADSDPSADEALLDALHREGAGWAEKDVRAAGELAGSAHTLELARLANTHHPVLHTHDRVGRRVDEVEFHPAWHALMATAVGLGLTGAAWRDERPGAHVARAATGFVWGQAEAGHMCPIEMTYAVVPALRHAPELAAAYEPLLASTEYDPTAAAPLTKRGLLAGMSMTEKQGGSDVRANTSRAEPAGDGSYAITGHKWFTSAPTCDLFLVLAYAPGGLSCFLLPRVLPDGSRNAMRLMRLKDKLGNRSNASSELEYERATGFLVGEEGRGVRTIIEMVNGTRLDVALAGAAGMRAALLAAVHQTTQRHAFGRALVDQPAMTAVLADMTLESEAATLLTMRVAGAADRAVRGDATESAFRRVAVALAKYWVCKRAPVLAAEALECFGGNGYIEDSVMPRLYREAPLGSIWEGSGNVVALDVLRALSREPATLPAFLAELDLAAGADRHLDAARTRLAEELHAPERPEAGARRTVELMALTLQASLLVRHSPPSVADAFCASRLGGDWGSSFGTLSPSVDARAIVARATPVLVPR